MRKGVATLSQLHLHTVPLERETGSTGAVPTQTAVTTVHIITNMCRTSRSTIHPTALTLSLMSVTCTPWTDRYLASASLVPRRCSPGQNHGTRMQGKRRDGSKKQNYLQLKVYYTIKLIASHMDVKIL